MDINADGQNDMVMATFEGTAFLVEGSEDGFRDPVHLLDENDELVRISMYWDLEEEDYLFVDRSAKDEDYIKEHHMTSSATVDWDNDGDQDLILGAYEGALYLCLNQGTKSKPIFSATNQQILADGKHLTIEGGLATPRVCDWNGDGLFDILCGGSKGGVYFYENTGEKGKPVFAAAKTLIKKATPGTDSEDYLASRSVPTQDGLPTRPGSSFHIEPVDYDNDGDLDLLVGAQSYYVVEGKELTEAEEEELSEVQSRMKTLNEQMSKIFEEIEDNDDKEKLDEIYDSEDFKKLQKELGSLWDRKNELEPGPQSANFIWLYRNNGGKTASPATEATSASETTSSDFGDQELETESSDSTEVTVAAKFADGDFTEGRATLSIQINIPKGYHIYGSRNSIAPTTVSFSETGGLKTAQPTKVPAGRLVMDSGKQAFWLEKKVTLKQDFDVPDSVTSTSVEGAVEFMMCNSKGCLPPKKVKFTASLKISR